MKVRLCLGLLFALLLGPWHANAATFERVRLFGADYVRLADVAAAQRLALRWIQPQSQVILTSRWTRMEFTVHSKRMRLNGVNVWLSQPVAIHQNVAYVGAADLSKTIYPILFPQKPPATQRIKTICLDPGHGGKDPGNQEGKRQEKTYALAFAREIRDSLVKKGFKVVMTRNADATIDLPDRVEFAKKAQADLLLSLHCNSADGPGGASVQGIEVFCMTPAGQSSTNAKGEGAENGSFAGNAHDTKNMLLAYRLQRKLVGTLKSEDRGVRRARFAVLRLAEMPAALVELGFMTNAAEGRKLGDAAYRKRAAQAITEAVIEYKKLMQRGES